MNQHIELDPANLHVCIFGFHCTSGSAFETWGGLLAMLRIGIVLISLAMLVKPQLRFLSSFGLFDQVRMFQIRGLCVKSLPDLGRSWLHLTSDLCSHLSQGTEYAAFYVFPLGFWKRAI